MDQPSITCPVCGMTSYHPTDVEMGYCGNCCAYTGVVNPLETARRASLHQKVTSRAQEIGASQQPVDVVRDD